MDNSFEHSSETRVDIGAMDQSASNSRTPTIVPEQEAEHYDMSGEKYLIILNQQKFMRTRHFKGKPTSRKYTNKDRSKLRKVFNLLDFNVIVMHNQTYHSIIKKLTAIATADHTNTSCICVAILTHGNRGGQIFAADRRYLLSEVMTIFSNARGLVGKPKMYFVQACRGGVRDAGQSVGVGRQTDGVLAKPTSGMPSSRGLSEMDGDSTDGLDSQSNDVLIVPSHADTLVLYACTEDHVSYRDPDGSWMIQALCKQIGDFRKTKDIHNIITRVNAEVARQTSKKNKKQIPETRYNLTKTLEFLLPN